MVLVGIAGTNGSGKDTVGEMLAERYGFLFVSVSDLLRDEARRRGLAVERENLRMISAGWRREFGLGVLVDKAIEKFKASADQHKGLVASPMRNTGEAQHLKDLGGTLIWVDADPHVRYDRIFSRRRSAEDDKTFEQFLAEEQAEAYSSGDAATLNVADVEHLADIKLINDGNDVQAFINYAESELQKLNLT